LKHLFAWNEARRSNAALYDELLFDLNNIITPQQADYAKHIYHVYAVRTQNRDEFISTMAEKDINCGIHYPIPVHLQQAYQYLGYETGSFPVAEKCAQELVSLPMFPELSKGQIQYVVHETKNFFTQEPSKEKPCLNTVK
jgi:dTDP-4-amino-4,6-dideoxygalactose transaminase